MSEGSDVADDADIEQHWECEDCGVVIYVASKDPEEPRYVACPLCGGPTEREVLPDDER